MITLWPTENSPRLLTDSKYCSKPSGRRASTSCRSAITRWASILSSSLCVFGPKTALSNCQEDSMVLDTQVGVMAQTHGKKYDVSVRGRSVFAVISSSLSERKVGQEPGNTHGC